MQQRKRDRYSIMNIMKRNDILPICNARFLRVKLSVVMLLILSFATLFMSLPASAQSIATGNGRITGQLVDGTNKNAPLAGQTVTLQVAQSGNAQDLTSAKTDAHGMYTFSNLSTDKTLNYAVYISYQGAQYVSDLVSLDSKPVQQLNLTAYEATTSSAQAAVVEGTVLLHEPDVQKGSITVSEIYFFKNLDTHTYVGSLVAHGAKPNALLFSLPTGARNIILGAGFNGYNVIQVDRGFASDAALPPGDTQFSFSYDIPYKSSGYDFRYNANYPTVQLSVLMPPDIQTTVSGLTSSGVVTADQHPYRLFKTNKLLPNQEIHIGMQGLPAPANTSAPSPLNTSTIWLIVGLLLMLAIIAVTSFLGRHIFLGKGTTKRSAVTKSHASPKRKSAAHRSSKDDDEAPRDHKKALLQELLELDTAYEEGKLSKSVYQERRAKTKARLRTLMSEQEASRK